MTFDLDERPGLRLRRMIPLFDEIGRPVPPQYHDMTIKEDLETCRVPPADEAATAYSTSERDPSGPRRWVGLGWAKVSPGWARVLS
ncbi:MAG: hypothetical protein ABI181_10395 [Mycobacteriaceae bacterium]